MGGKGSGAKPKVYPAELVERVRFLYGAGWSQAEVAADVGLSQKVIWKLMARHGITRRRQIKRNQFGSCNTSWKGESASYKAKHQRLYRYNRQVCAECGTTEPTRAYQWASLTGRYGDPADYRRLCQSCHAKFDGVIKNITKGVITNA